MLATTTLAGVISLSRNNTADDEEDRFENPNNNNNSELVSTDFLVGERTDAAEDNIISCRYRSSFSQFQEDEHHRTTTIDGRQLSRPIPQTPRRLSTILVPPTPEANEHRGGGGTLILRPNPVKAADIITTTNLSPAELVRAAATATSEQPQVVELQQHCADEATTTTNSHEKASQHPKTTANTTNNTTTTTTTEEKKLNEGWNTAQARQAEKEAKRMLKEAQQQRKQEFQVNFPEDNNGTFAMPYSSSHEEKLSGNNHSHSRNEGARIRNSTQQSHPQHRGDQMGGMRASSGAESLGNRNNNNNRNSEDVHPEAARAVQPTPLFERLVTEEVQELKTYAGIVERQNVELAKQKKVQEDLEARLRGETRRRKELESLLEEQERLWSEKFAELEQERNAAEKKLQDEQTKTKKLINQVQRKDRDIHDFFKKKVCSRVRSLQLHHSKSSSLGNHL